jgi:hypothetical protein
MKNFILSLLLAFLVLGCKSVTQTDKNYEKTQLISTDSVFVDHYYDFHDTIFVQVPSITTMNKECDSLCQKEVSKLLQIIKTHKAQGSQSQGIYYDHYKNSLVIYQNVSPLQNIYRNRKQDLSNVKEIERIKIVKETYIPKFVKFLSCIGAFSILLGIVLGIRKLKNKWL